MQAQAGNFAGLFFCLYFGRYLIPMEERYEWAACLACCSAATSSSIRTGFDT